MVRRFDDAKLLCTPTIVFSPSFNPGHSSSNPVIFPAKEKPPTMGKHALFLTKKPLYCPC
jgi:hypothetical protein